MTLAAPFRQTLLTKAFKPQADSATVTAPGMRILANNTDEGPEAAPGGGELLRWTISPRTTQAPTALIVTGG